MAKEMPPQEYLKECFNYDPSTGHLIWKTRPVEHFKTKQAWSRWNNKYSSCRADHVAPDNRHYTGIANKRYLAYRVIWKLIYGNSPEFIDHIDRDSKNNKLNNLRMATRADNQHNTVAQQNSKTGLKGVSWAKHAKKFTAQIYTEGKAKSLGYFSTPQEAHNAYCETAKVQHGEFINNGA
jgi:hypothetical protein